MKKQKIQLIVLLAALIVAAAAFFGIKKYSERRGEEESLESEPDYTVLELDEENVTAFSYSGAGGEYSFEKTGSGEETGWKCLEDESLELDADKVSKLVSNALFLQSDTCIENVEDLSQYGLEKPEVSVSVTTSGGEACVILFGDYNDITSEYYFCLEGENSVYTLDLDVASYFDVTPEELLPDEEESEDSTAGESETSGENNTDD